MKKIFTKTLALAILGMVLTAGQVMAIPTLEITASNGTTTFTDTVTDGDLIKDLEIELGDVFWFGRIGFLSSPYANGITKGAIGSAAIPTMHFGGGITSKNYSSTTFTVKFSETDFKIGADITGFISSINGAGGTQSLMVYYDTDNELFGTGTLLANLTTIDTQSSYNGSMPAPNTLFSLTMISTITLGPSSSASFDNTLNPTPEPATMLLFGTGLAGLGTAFRRRMNKVA